MGHRHDPGRLVPKLMPWAIAAELLLLAERVGAERAREVGLINKIVPAEDLLAEAEAIAERLCQLSPVAVQGMKESMVRASNLDHTALDQITDQVQTRVMNSEDRQEGGRAFVEKYCDRDKIGRRLIGLYNELMGNS